MRFRIGITGALLLLIVLVLPAGAFTAKELTISVQQNGDAQVDLSYELSFLERIAVFAQISDPAKELKSALETNFKKAVDITRAESDGASFTIHSFAIVNRAQEGTTYTTPSLSFEHAERVLKQYWFAPLISPDFSPDTTKVVFPDGETETRFDSLRIPSFTKTVRQ